MKLVVASQMRVGDVMMTGNMTMMMCVCVFMRESVFDVRSDSHLQDSLELFQFRFLLLDFTVSVLAQFNQQQAGDIQHFLKHRGSYS